MNERLDASLSALLSWQSLSPTDFFIESSKQLAVLLNRFSRGWLWCDGNKMAGTFYRH